MNPTPLHVMQIVLWVVILSTFCYTWLSSEPVLKPRREQATHGGATSADVTSLPFQTPHDAGSFSDGVLENVPESGFEKVLKIDSPEERESFLKLEIPSEKALQEPKISQPVENSVTGAKEGDSLKTEGDPLKKEEPDCFSHPTTGIEKVIGDYIKETGCPISFFLFWTTKSEANETAKSDGFQTRHLRSAESAFVTHPAACVIFLSVLKFENRFMSELQAKGFRLLILDEFDVTSLLKYTPTEVWYQKVEEWRKGKYFFSHFTDLMRLAVLYKFGGVYIDTDCIVMQDVTDVRNAFGAQLTNYDTGVHKEVDGGVMMFDRGSTFLYECMVEASGNYNKWDWEFNGPGLLKRMLKRDDLEGSYIVLPTMAIYPIYYRDIWAYFDVNGDNRSADEQAALWARMRNETRVFHWYNQFALKHRARPGSLMHAAFNEFCIFCDEVVE